MSRTYRKHHISFEQYYGRFNPIYWSQEMVDKYMKQEHYKFKGDRHRGNHYDYTLPKEYRKSVNRRRRRKDKHEIWKELNLNDYENQCSKWNCKDSESWGYW